jgi:lipoate-protein ligase A
MPRDFALYLASIMVNPDLEAIDAYLAHPSREPEYREGRGHRDFVVGLEELAGRRLEPAKVAESLRLALDDDMHAGLDYFNGPSIKSDR